MNQTTIPESTKKVPNLYVWIITNFQRHKTTIHSAQVSFFILVSFFPFIALVTKIMSYSSIIDHEKIDNIIHGDEIGYIGKTILGWIDDVHTTSGGLVIVISAIVLMWTGSKGVDGLAQGMDSIYGSTGSKRGYVKRRITSVIFMVAAIILALACLVLLAFGRDITNILMDELPLLKNFNVIFIILRYVAAFLIFMGFFVLLFRFLPYMPAETKSEKLYRLAYNKKCEKKDRIKKPKLRSIKTEFPGALLTSLMWIIFSRLYGLYMSYQVTHSTIYGSLTGFFLTLLWLYYCTMFTFIGALYNNYKYATGESATAHIIKDIPGLFRWIWTKLPFAKKKTDSPSDETTNAEG